jgi:hypothetical protein
MQRNVTPRVNFVPRGELCPLGTKALCLPSVLLKRRLCSSLMGANGGVNVSPRGEM